MLKSVYIPEENISTDEEWLLWKGKLLFKQYIALERAILGIKMFSLCETTSYLWNSVYPGKEPEAAVPDMEVVRRLGKTGAVISRLMEGLLGKDYNKWKLHVDNWYTIEKLFFFLLWEWDS